MAHKQKNSRFFKKWGVYPHDLAEQEGVSIEAIHMRTMNYGTPFQRKNKPSKWEIMTGKTIVEICLQLNLHPVTVIGHYHKYGKLTAPCKTKRGQHMKGRYKTIHWSKNSKFNKIKPWLMPEHPDYNFFRNCTEKERKLYCVERSYL